jgi:cobalt-zinc-cadmium resistance protein CzcA
MNKIIGSVIAFSLKNKYFIFFATLLLFIAGIITFKNMPIEAFPDVTNTDEYRDQHHYAMAGPKR